MSDQLYLTYRLRGFTEHNMLRHYERMLRAFPYSKLAERRQAVLRVHAVALTEPPVLERPLLYPIEIEDLLVSAREFDYRDSAIELDAHWDLWQFNEDWALSPVNVTLGCYSPHFETGEGEHLRINLGLDVHFLPQPDKPNYLFMARSNIRSLLHLVSDLDGILSVDTRRLETDSAENFAERVQAMLGPAG